MHQLICLRYRHNEIHYNHHHYYDHHEADVLSLFLVFIINQHRNCALEPGPVNCAAGNALAVQFIIHNKRMRGNGRGLCHEDPLRARGGLAEKHILPLRQREVVLGTHCSRSMERRHFKLRRSCAADLLHGTTFHFVMIYCFSSQHVLKEICNSQAATETQPEEREREMERERPSEKDRK